MAIGTRKKAALWPFYSKNLHKLCLSVALLLPLIFTFSASAYSKRQCEKILRNRQLKYLVSTEPVQVLNKAGLPKAITLSYDSELSYVDVIRTTSKSLSKDSEYLKFVESHPISIEKLMTLFDFANIAEVKRNAFLPGKGKQIQDLSTLVYLSDLKPAYAGIILDEYKSSVLLWDNTPKQRKFHLMFTPEVQKLTDKMELPAKVGMDMYGIEIRHSSFEQVPLKAYKQINQLKKEFRNPRTQFHFGVPDSIDVNVPLYVARVIEAIVLLSIGDSDPNDSIDIGFNQFSSLVGKEATSWRIGDRGVIKLELNEFREPQISHDLEIRYYRDHSQLIALIELGLHLFANHRRFRDFSAIESGFKNEVLFDSTHGNIFGALYFMGHVFLDQESPEYKEVGQGLLRLAEQVARTTNSWGQVAMITKKKVWEFLDDNGVLEMIEPEIFLTP